MTSTTSSNKTLKKKRMRNHLKERVKTTTSGSILPKAGKGGLDLKKIHKGNVQNDREEICNVVLEQSSSSTAIKSNVRTKAVAVQRSRAR